MTLGDALDVRRRCPSPCPRAGWIIQDDGEDMRNGDHMTKERLAVHDDPDGPTAECRFCHHPIRHYPAVGWVDVTSVQSGGLYDFCVSNDGEHIPLRTE